VNINFLGSQRFYYPKTAFSAVEGKQLFIFSALMAFTMFWGSWWAYQEGSWGGWWAWDPSETFGLFIFLIIIYAKHSNFKSLILDKINFRLRLLIYFLFLVYLFTQANFGLTSHDFGMQDMLDLNSRDLYFILISLIALNFLRVVSAKRHPASLISPFNHLGTPVAATYYIYQILLLLVIAMFPLIIDLAWKLLLLQFTTPQLKYWLILLVIYFTALIFFADTSSNAHLMAYVVIILTQYPPHGALFLMFILLKRKQAGAFQALHFCVAVFMLFSLVSNLLITSTFGLNSMSQGLSSPFFFSF
jgi:cytochrome c biogenesis factor